MATVGCKGVTDTSATLYMIDTSGQYLFVEYIFYNANGNQCFPNGTFVGKPNSENFECECTGLTPNTTYQVLVIAHNVITGIDDYIDILLVTTTYSSPIWSLNPVSIGTISETYNEYFFANTYELYRYAVTFNVSGTATFYTTNSGDTIGFLTEDELYDAENGSPYNIIAGDDDYGEDTNFRFTHNVSAGTTYYLWVRHYGDSSYGYINLYIEPPETVSAVSEWRWDVSNGQATASQTYNAYLAVVNRTATSNFSYLVWNDMVDKVKEIIDALGGIWDTTYATYENTKLTAYNKTLTATRFNSLRYNIGSRYSTGIYEVSPGDSVLGSYFTTLASCINGWIARDL